VTTVTSAPVSVRERYRMEPVQPTILIVDDDYSLREALKSVLVPMGYRVLIASEPEAAYALLDGEHVDVVLLDVRMPTMSGPALYLAVVHCHPEFDGRVAFLSAEPEAADVRPWLEHNHCIVFRKPLQLDPLVRWIEQAVKIEDERRRRHG
jgi:DNA-binding NtrC family response regulator